MQRADAFEKSRDNKLFCQFSGRFMEILRCFKNWQFFLVNLLLEISKTIFFSDKTTLRSLFEK